MTDLRTALHAAAPTPSRPVDVDALVSAAARRRPWMRIGLWLGALTAVAGVGAGATGVLSPAGHPTDVDTAPVGITVPVRPTPASTTDGGSVLAGSSTAGSPARTSLPGATHRTSRTTSPSPASAPAAAATSSEGCDVRSAGDGISNKYGGVGMDSPSANTCTYTATVAGGYRGAGTWWVTITRDGETTRFAYDNAAPTCATGVIRPGDVVTVGVRAPGGATTAETQVQAGPDVSCQ